MVIVCVKDSTASITDVNIEPNLPTPLDAISIVTFGREANGPVFVTDTDFRRDGVLLELDISLDVGFLPAETPWSHSELIGTLPSGLYDLTVRTLEQSVVTDTYSTSFEVVPEPITFLFLAIGILGIRSGKHRS